MRPIKRRRILIEKIQALKKQYEETVNSNRAAWRSHGSELCAGDMKEKEEKILEEIRHLETMLAMPQIYMSDKAINQAIKEQKEIISAIEAGKAALSREKQRINNFLSLLKSIKEIS